MQDCLKGLKYIQNDLIKGTVSPFSLILLRVTRGTIKQDTGIQRLLSMRVDESICARHSLFSYHPSVVHAKSLLQDFFICALAVGLLADIMPAAFRSISFPHFWLSIFVSCLTGSVLWSISFVFYYNFQNILRVFLSGVH